MTFAGCLLDEISVDPAGIVSDHALVVCRLPVVVGQAAVAERLVRGWRRVVRDELRRALEESALCRAVADDVDVDELFATYDSVLRDVANRLAPQHVLRHRAGRLAPWFDAECRAVRRNCRRLERRYRRTRGADDQRCWVHAVRQRFQLYRTKKEAYWLDRLTQHGKSLPLLWRSLSSMLGCDRNITGATGHTADGFAMFFARKVEDVMASTAGQPSPAVLETAPSSLSSFRP
jgi:hypothetical protein